MPAPSDLSCGAGVRDMLHALMPGEWSTGHCTRLSRLIAQVRLAASNPGTSLCPAAPPSPATAALPEALRLSQYWGTQVVVTVPDRVAALTWRVDLCAAGHIWDLWAFTRTIARTLEASRVRVRNNDVNPHLPGVQTYLGSLAPDSYETWQRRELDYVMGSPYFALLGFVLPLAVAPARLLMCMHVPAAFCIDATAQRLSYLRARERAGRLFTVLHLPRGPLGRRCMWLLVFATPGLARRLLR